MRTVIGIAAIVFFTLATWADTIHLSNSRKATGDIGYFDGKRFHVQRDRQPDTRVHKRSVRIIDFGKDGKLGLFLLKDDRRTVVTVSSFKNKAFACKAEGDKPLSIHVDDVRQAMFFSFKEASRKLQVPYAKQNKPGYSGESCLEMLSALSGRRVPQDEVHRRVGLLSGKGIRDAAVMQLSIRKLGLTLKGGFQSHRIHRKMQLDFRALIERLAKGQAVLVGLQNEKVARSLPGYDRFVILVGYDLRERTVFVHDPEQAANHKLSFDQFIERWRNRRSEYFALFVAPRGGEGVRQGHEHASGESNVPFHRCCGTGRCCGMGPTCCRARVCLKTDCRRIPPALRVVTPRS